MRGEVAGGWRKLLRGLIALPDLSQAKDVTLEAQRLVSASFRDFYVPEASLELQATFHAESGLCGRFVNLQPCYWFYSIRSLSPR